MDTPPANPDARINYLLEQIGVGTWECEHGAGRLSHNGTFTSGGGLSAEVVESRLDDWIALIHPDDLERMRTEFFSAAPDFDS